MMEVVHALLTVLGAAFLGAVACLLVLLGVEWVQRRGRSPMRNFDDTDGA